MTVLELIAGKLALMLTGTVPVLTGLEAVNEAVSVIGQDLARRKSDLVRQETILTFPAESTSQNLPSGFAGFEGHPVLVGGSELMLLPDLKTADSLRGNPGTPIYYEMLGDQLCIYPESAAGCTVKCMAKIVPILTITSELPWQGLFNNLIVTAAVQLSQKGYAVLADPQFMSIIAGGVSSVLIPRQPALPRRRPVSFF